MNVPFFRRFCFIFIFFSVCMVADFTQAAETLGQASQGLPSTAKELNNTDAKNKKIIAKNIEQSSSFDQVWKERFAKLDELNSASAVIEKSVKKNSQEISETLQYERKEFTRLLNLYQVSHDHPVEQMTLVYRMKKLQTRLAILLQPLKKLNENNQDKVTEVARLKKEIIDTSKATEGVFDGIEGQELINVKAYQKQLASTEKSITAVSTRLSQQLTPANTTLSQLKKVVDGIEDTMQQAWVEYYFNPTSFFTISAKENSEIATGPENKGSWQSFFSASTILSVPQDSGEIFYSGRNFFLCLAVMLGGGFWVYQKAKKLPARWQSAVQSIIKGAWIWVAIGFSLLIASAGSYGEVYFSFVLTGVLVLIWGVGSLSWSLRLAAKPELAGKPLPFVHLYIPAALGVFFLYVNVPSGLLGIIWMIIMVAFVLGVSFVNRQQNKKEGLPMLETFLYGCSRYISLISLIVSLLGYPRLAILFFMFLFALANLITLISALTSLLSLLADRTFNKNNQPVRNVMARSFVVPFAFLFSLLGTLPWKWAIPGGTSLVKEAMAINYTIGSANFDFSYLLVITILFFVFRSAINIGTTLLTHLPQRLPDIESGVIPPLRTLLVYGAWAVFLLISLGLLGVSLTSIAVVAGGLSVGIGFGMQNIFNNLVSGLLLIFGRTILVGDIVQVAGVTGTVRDISIRCTTIETSELALLYVPNSLVMSGAFTNWTRNHRRVQKSFQIGVAYDSNLSLVNELFFEAVKLQDKILKNPSPIIRLENFGNSSLDFTITIQIEDVSSASDVLSQLKKDLVRLFNENSIEIPFPQLDVHLQKEQDLLPNG